MSDGPRSGRTRYGWILVGALVFACLVAVSASGTSVLAPLRRGRPDRLAMLVTAGVVVAAGAVAAVLVVLVVQLVLRTRPGAPPLRRTLRVAVPASVVALALLALAAVSVTGMTPATPHRPKPTPTPTTAAAPAPTGTGRIGDFDHDGTLDFGVDVDGDGRVDWIAVRPQDTTNPGPQRLYVQRRNGRWVGAVDTDGDGTIDGYVTLDADGDGAIDTAPGVSRADADRYLKSVPPTPAPAPVAPTASAPEQRADPPRSTADDPLAGVDTGALGWILVALAGAVVVALLAAGAVVLVRGLGRRPTVVPAAPDELAQAREAMAATMVGSIDAMLADPDPRTAVIGAYARLLEGLAACGLARHAYEAPMEHLRRVLLDLRVRPEPLRALTELFERARFSPHPLTDADRAAALAALREAAADLAAVVPAGAA
ncbi:MAG TPA: DUF4129 domain-containing protein [Actinocatenispora sp.]